MGWIFTFCASCGELVMIWGMKQPNRMIVFWAWLIGTLIAGFFLNRAFLLLDSSSVYPVWVSIGSIGSLIMGYKLFGEVLSSKQVRYIALLILACAGLLVEGS